MRAGKTGQGSSSVSEGAFTAMTLIWMQNTQFGTRLDMTSEDQPFDLIPLYSLLLPLMIPKPSK